jgi:hypothetical protein
VSTTKLAFATLLLAGTLAAEYFFSDREQNRTYGFKLNPKWIYDDGRTMCLIWSDASDNHTTNYKLHYANTTNPPRILGNHRLGRGGHSCLDAARRQRRRHSWL